MGRDVVSAKLDIIFKKFFTENVDMLYSFVASMLDIPQESISEIKITNPELPPDSLEGKFSRLDLNLKVNNRLVNVEIQMKNEPDYRDRTLFYWAKLYFRTKERRELQRTKADDYNKYYQFQYV